MMSLSAPWLPWQNASLFAGTKGIISLLHRNSHGVVRVIGGKYAANPGDGLRLVGRDDTSAGPEFTRSWPPSLAFTSQLQLNNRRDVYFNRVFHPTFALIPGISLAS